MNDLKAQLQDSLAIVKENKQLKAENELLKARLRIADLKLQRRSDDENEGYRADMKAAGRGHLLG